MELQTHERAPSVQSNETDDTADGWRIAQWQLCPNAVALEEGGDCVLLDGVGRPIVRIFADGRTEILVPGAEFKPRRSYLLHFDFGLPPEKPARDYVRRYVETYNLAPELRRRREILRRKAFPRWQGERVAA